MVFGVFIVVLGILLLLRNAGVIHGNFWNLVWPLFIVAAGVSLIFKKRHR